LVGVFEQEPDAVADEIGGGEVAADQQRLEVETDLSVGERRA
jgi:hypothetical protein